MASTALMLLVVGCSGSTASTTTTTKTPRGHLPVTPSRVKLPPGPAILDTATAFTSLTIAGQPDWATATARLSGSWDLTYRAPETWETTNGRAAQSRNQLISARAGFTPLRERSTPMSSYLAQLADDTPIQMYVTPNGFTVYVISREVSIAPTDPDAASAWFHTALIDVAGRIAKVEVSYPTEEHFRYGDLAPAILGTIEVIRTVQEQPES